MNREEKCALKNHSYKLRKTLKPSVNVFLAILEAKGIFSGGEKEEIDEEKLTENKLTSLLKKLKTKETGFSALLFYLETHDNKKLAEILNNDACGNGQSVNGRERALWRVPSSNHFFTGRQTLIDQLHTYLGPFDATRHSNSQKNQVKSQNTVRLAVCHGLGGVGKTQLAIEFVHRHKENFCEVFWFSAKDSTQIESEYEELAKELGCWISTPRYDIVHRLKAWFAAHPGCLLVYDNASNIELIEEYMPESGCYVLITSRNVRKWFREGNDIAVNVFEFDEATDYIKKILKDGVANHHARELAERLGCLPLALSQACGQIRDRDENISDYLRQHEKLLEEHLSVKTLLRKEHEPVFSAWDSTIEAIKEENLFATNLLNICSYFHSKNIPCSLLESFTENTEMNPEKQSFESARGVLREYSMIKMNDAKDAISLHPIVQQVIRLKIEKQNNSVFLVVLKTVIKKYPPACSFEDHEKIQFIPHLENILYHLHRSEDLNSFKIAILELLGTIYLQLQRYAESRDKLTEALRLKEHNIILNPLEVTTTLGSLINAYGSLGDYTKKRECLERTLKMKEDHYGSDHMEVAIILDNLANACGNLEDYPKQREYLDRALGIEEQHYDLPGTAERLVSLGNAYGSLREYFKKRECLARALKNKEDHYGSDHVEVAIILANLASACGGLKDYRKKLEYLERALVIFKIHQCSDYVEEAELLVNIARKEIEHSSTQCIMS